MARLISLPAPARYGLAAASAVVAVAARLALNPLWGIRFTFMMLVPAVVLSGWVGGLGPGVLATVLCAVPAAYFWIEPRDSWAITDKTEVLGLLLFLALGVAISFLNEAWRRGAKALAESEERLRVTLGSIGDGIITTDDHGKVVGLNAVAERLTGWTQAEATGRPLEEILVIVNEQSRQPAADPVHRVLSEGVVSGLANHTLLVTRDGRVIPIDDSAAPIREQHGRIVGVVMVFRDISERRQTEHERAGLLERERAARVQAERARQAVERSAQTWRLTVEAAPAAMIMVDRHGRITLVNALTEQLLGYTREEILDRSVDDLVPPRFRGGHADFRRSFFLDPRHRAMGEGRDLYAVRKDGSEVPVEIGLSPIETAEGSFVLAAVTDITIRKQVEERRAEVLRREQAARVEMERASKLKDDFLAMVSHDLRTPLNAVVGYAHMLRIGKVAPDRVNDALETIQRNAQAQARLVDSLLDLSRIAAGKLELDVSQVDLSVVVRDAIEVVRPDAELKGIALEADMPASAVEVTGDGARLQQVLWNLLTNAIKFTPGGGRVDVRLTAGDSHARIDVRDSGDGIPQDFLPFVFDRFRQADREKSRAGLGLGLALVREMVHAHGGAVTAESAGEGQGSTFTVTLPLVASTATPSTLMADEDHGVPT